VQHDLRVGRQERAQVLDLVEDDERLLVHRDRNAEARDRCHRQASIAPKRSASRGVPSGTTSSSVSCVIRRIRRGGRVMTAQEHVPRVLIAGGGIAALELVLAVRALAGSSVGLMLLTAEPRLAPRAMSVAEPFDRGAAQTWDWAQIAADQHAQLVLDKLAAIDVAERIVFTQSGRHLRYDVLVLATGARRVEPLAGALTFGTRDTAAADLRAMVAGVRDHGGGDIVFALPSPSIWPLPLYELALQTADELREHGCPATVRIVTPEQHPLELFGPAARDAVEPLLDALAIGLRTSAQPREVLAGGLRLAGGELIAADHVVTLADVLARPVPGLPVDRAGFIPVDLHGAVICESAVYAAGEATSFPLR
jgi:sulfide:quinone oxidoreductase